MSYRMELSSVLCSLFKYPRGGLAQFCPLDKLLLLSTSGKHSHRVMWTCVRELSVACDVTRYVYRNFSINQNIEQVRQTTFFGGIIHETSQCYEEQGDSP